MLHSQTMLILASLLFLALPFMVWLAVKPDPDGAVAWWCAAGLLAGAGVSLLELRSSLGEAVGFYLANACLMGCLLMWSQSLRITQGQAWPLRTMALWSVLCLGGLGALRAALTPASLDLGVRFLLGALALHTAHEAWRLFRSQRSRNAAVISANFAVLGAMLWLQGLAAHSVEAPVDFGSSWGANLLAVTVLATAMVSHFCFVGMKLDRAANEQINAELALQSAQQTRILDAELHHLDRRRRMAILSGSLAHELNQPLTAALVNAQLAQRHWSEDPLATPGFLALLDKVDTGIARTAEILQRIRDGSDIAWPELRMTDLQRVLEHSLQQVEPDIKRLGVSLTVERAPGPLHCQGDEVALSQVLVNVLRNALQSMAQSPSRRLTVTCRAQNDMAQVMVSDTGVGLDDVMLERWGEPMLSTKPEGLGMGLAISREIMARHAGHLTLSNRPQGGVQATLSLPRVRDCT